MIFLGKLKQVEGDLYSVNVIHYRPLDEKYGYGKTIEELEEEGVLVETLPDPEDNGKSYKTLVNIVTKNVIYQYNEEQLPLEEVTNKISILEAGLANAEYSLMMGGLL